MQSNDLEPAAALEIASAAARLPATQKAGAALKACLTNPPEHGKITLQFGDGKLYRVLREESF